MYSLFQEHSKNQIHFLNIFQKKVVVGIRVIQYKNPTESAGRCQVEKTRTGNCIPKIRIEIMNQR